MIKAKLKSQKENKKLAINAIAQHTERFSRILRMKAATKKIKTSSFYCYCRCKCEHSLANVSWTHVQHKIVDSTHSGSFNIIIK